MVWQRPLWVALLVALMIPTLGLVGRFENAKRPAASRTTVMLVLGGLVACTGLALLALRSVVVDGNVHWVALALPVLGAWMSGTLRFGR